MDQRLGKTVSRAAGSNLRMVRPSLMVVKLLIIRARSARIINSFLIFLAVRSLSHCTSASNWDSKAWKFSHTERKSYACALIGTYPAEFYYSNLRPHKRRTHTGNYVSTSAENGPAMAGKAGPVRRLWLGSALSHFSCWFLQTSLSVA